MRDEARRIAVNVATLAGVVAEGLARCQRHARRFGRSIRKYLRTNLPSRPWNGPPQQRHATSPSIVPAGSSNPTTSYFAAQIGQWNSVAIDLDILKYLPQQMQQSGNQQTQQLGQELKQVKPQLIKALQQGG
jgi:hypothetical protein